MRHFTILAGILSLGISTAASAATYDINITGFDVPGSSITGQMTFDGFGAQGLPSAWDLVASSPKIPFTEIPLKSTASFGNLAFASSPNAFLATDTGLFFDLGGNDVVSFYDFTGISGSLDGFCLVGDGAGTTGFPGGGCGGRGQVGILFESSTVAIGPSAGVLQIGTIVPTVPIPASGLMFLTALAGFGALRKLRRPA